MYNHRLLHPEPTPMDIPSVQNHDDHFFMYIYKIKRCYRSKAHDWTQCPFLHKGEKARRRDPAKYHYAGFICPHNRVGVCNKGDMCENSHGVFEYWLHPARYRTRRCNAGLYCRRKVCFFAHTVQQLRPSPINKCVCQSRMHGNSRPVPAFVEAPMTFAQNPVAYTYIETPLGLVEVPLTFENDMAMEMPPDYPIHFPPMAMPQDLDFPPAAVPMPMPMPQDLDIPPAAVPVPVPMPMPQDFDFPAAPMPMLVPCDFPPAPITTAPSFPSTSSSSSSTTTAAANQVQSNWENVLATMGLLKIQDDKPAKEEYNWNGDGLEYNDLEWEMELPNVDWVDELVYN